MTWLRSLLILLVFRPVARLLTGADVVGREHLPLAGPAIIAANHNSHVDTFLLLTLFPARTLRHVRPAAAADYFLANPLISWFSRRIIGIVPVHRDRAGQGGDVLAPLREALQAGDILVIFPEGTRGADGQTIAPFKSGVARLSEETGAPVVPVWIQGAGRVLPKGEVVPAPMTCCVHVGAPIPWNGDRARLLDDLRAAMERLRAAAPPLRWRDTEVDATPAPAAPTLEGRPS